MSIEYATPGARRPAIERAASFHCRGPRGARLMAPAAAVSILLSVLPWTAIARYRTGMIVATVA